MMPMMSKLANGLLQSGAFNKAKDGLGGLLGSFNNARHAISPAHKRQDEMRELQRQALDQLMRQRQPPQPVGQRTANGSIFGRGM